MQKPFLTPEVLAIRWNITPKTLSQWRWNGHGPKYCKIGKLVRYLVEDIEAFERSKRHTFSSKEVETSNTSTEQRT